MRTFEINFWLPRNATYKVEAENLEDAVIKAEAKVNCLQPISISEYPSYELDEFTFENPENE